MPRTNGTLNYRVNSLINYNTDYVITCEIWALHGGDGDDDNDDDDDDLRFGAV
jgi:hypothetical protein